MARVVLACFAVSAHALMLDTSKRAGSDGRCLVWHSQHKAGGQAITNHLFWVPMMDTGFELHDWRRCGGRCRFNCDKLSWDCEKQKCIEPLAFRNGNAELNVRIAESGYVQTLRGSPTWGQAGDGKCVWATMSREPTSRLVSAYLFCKNMHPHDPLCGFDRLDATKATLQEFALHWGNYLLRELLLFPELRALAEARPDFKASAKQCRTQKDGRSVGDEYSGPWVQFKDQLNGGENIETESGKSNLEAVKDHLLGRNGYKPLYDLIGLLDEWENTMSLFDIFMPLNHTRTWVQDLGHLSGGTHSSWKYDDEKAKTLEEARKDASVQRAIAGDIVLYNEAIVPIFRMEMDKHKNTR